MELRTRRFVLRDFEYGDMPAFEECHVDCEECRRDLHARPGSRAEKSGREHAARLMDLFRAWATERPRLNYQLAVVRRDEPESLIGCCGLRRERSDPESLELGIELAPVHRSRYGYAVELLLALGEFGFEHLGARELIVNTVDANRRVVRLAEAFGATAVTLPSPPWMSARGWRWVQWRFTGTQWHTGRTAWTSSPLFRRWGRSGRLTRIVEGDRSLLRCLTGEEVRR